MRSIAAATLLLAPLASAHFKLNWPPARGFDEVELVQFPCGGQNTVSKTRTPWPLNGKVPIQLYVEHARVLMEVLIAVGNDPGVNFDTIVMPTFVEVGSGTFCLGDVVIPDSLGLKAGDNATIQVQTSGDPNGGLYNCADITFTNKPLSTSQYNSHCTNSTQFKIDTLKNGANINANGTKVLSPSSSQGGGSGSLASHATPAGWLLGAAVIVGLFAIL